MDLDQCLSDALFFMANNEPENAAECFEDLAEWIHKGGFLPDLSKAKTAIESHEAYLLQEA
jgi:hypothetical protein